MIDWSTCTAVERDPDRVTGAWVFRGTRVPVAALFENLEDDASIQDLRQPPLGAGEAASAPVPAALANAVFDATGMHLYTVPFTRERVKALVS